MKKTRMVIALVALAAAIYFIGCSKKEIIEERMEDTQDKVNDLDDKIEDKFDNDNNRLQVGQVIETSDSMGKINKTITKVEKILNVADGKDIVQITLDWDNISYPWAVEYGRKNLKVTTENGVPLEDFTDENYNTQGLAQEQGNSSKSVISYILPQGTDDIIIKVVNEEDIHGEYEVDI